MDAMEPSEASVAARLNLFVSAIYTAVAVECILLVLPLWGIHPLVSLLRLLWDASTTITASSSSHHGLNHAVSPSGFNLRHPELPFSAPPQHALPLLCVGVAVVSVAGAALSLHAQSWGICGSGRRPQSTADCSTGQRYGAATSVAGRIGDVRKSGDHGKKGATGDHGSKGVAGKDNNGVAGRDNDSSSAAPWSRVSARTVLSAAVFIGWTWLWTADAVLYNNHYFLYSVLLAHVTMCSLANVDSVNTARVMRAQVSIVCVEPGYAPKFCWSS
jgi:hypothetical protein